MMNTSGARIHSMSNRSSVRLAPLPGCCRSTRLFRGSSLCSTPGYWLATFQVAVGTLNSHEFSYARCDYLIPAMNRRNSASSSGSSLLTVRLKSATRASALYTRSESRAAIVRKYSA